MTICRRINQYQFFVLVFTFMIGNTILNAPALITSHAKQDAWIAGVLSLFLAMGLVLLYFNLYKRFPTKTIVQYIEILLGKKIGKFISFLLVFYLFLLSALMTRQLGDFVLTYILPETPIQYIYLMFLGIVVMGSYLGLETLARSCEVWFPFILILLIFLLLFLTEEREIANLKPILENGINPVLKGTIAFIGIPYLQLIVFSMVLPYVEKSKRTTRLPFLLGMFIAGSYLTASILHSLLIIGPILTEYKEYPIYFMAQKISLGEIIERIEVIVSIIWFTTIFFKTSILFYSSYLGLSQTLNLTNSRPILLPLGILLFVLSNIISENIVDFDLFFNLSFPPLALTFGFLLPLFLLFIAVIRKKHFIEEQG